MLMRFILGVPIRAYRYREPMLAIDASPINISSLKRPRPIPSSLSDIEHPTRLASKIVGQVDVRVELAATSGIRALAGRGTIANSHAVNSV